MLPSIRHSLFALLLVVTTATPALSAPSAEPWPVWDSANQANEQTIDHSLWQKLLDKYIVVDGKGINRFDYVAAVAQRAKLQQYIDDLKSLDPRNFNRDEQMAYWINLYNALTVQLVIENVKDGQAVSSIRKLGQSFFSRGPWDDTLITIADIPLTLNDIEHRILRPIWRDDRIHFAVNCASIGCPNLQRQAFIGSSLQAQLDEAALQYLLHPRGVQVIVDNKTTVYLSSIFKWYGEDFGNNRSERLQRLQALANGALPKALFDPDAKIKYRYDWSLNGA